MVTWGACGGQGGGEGNSVSCTPGLRKATSRAAVCQVDQLSIQLTQRLCELPLVPPCMRPCEEMPPPLSFTMFLPGTTRPTTTARNAAPPLPTTPREPPR